MPPIQGIIRSSRNGGIDPLDGSSQELWVHRLATIFESVLARRPDHFQIRYIGLADGGKEIVRVERGPAGIKITPPSELQRKAHESYFTIGAEAPQGEVAFSEVTYNREQGKLDPRLIPTIRGMLPVFDQFGRRFGMLVINVNYNAMLKDAVQDMRPHERTFVINGQGDYMEHPGGEGEPLPLELHGFYTRTAPAVISKAMTSTKPVSVFQTDHTISVAISNNDHSSASSDRVTIVIQMPKDKLYARANQIGLEVVWAGGIVVLLFLLGSFYFARSLMGSLSNSAIAIVENITDGLILVDKSGTIERFNAGCERIFGYRSSEVVGKPVAILMSPESVKRHSKALASYKSGATSRVVGNINEVDGLTKDGRIVPIELSVAELNLDGRMKFSGLIRDISERRELDRVKTEFVSTVSHELRTPLTSIRGSLGLVGKMIPSGLPDAIYQMITLAQKNTDRLITLVNDILDFEKLTSNQVRYELETVLVEDELTQAVELIQGYADQFSVEIALKLPAESIQIRVDINRFQQILANLLSNAIKFSPPSGTVTLKAVKTDTGVYIAISDEGEGIPEEFRDKIFAPFSQADSTTTRKIGGTGLGLSITKKLVEDMNGSIDFETTTNTGTTFWIFFPSVDDDDVRREPAQRAADDTRLLGLHIEDDADFATVLAEMFKDTVRMERARSLAEARSRLAKGRFDLIIIDVALRDGNGLELLEDLPADWDSEVVVLTAIDRTYDDPRISMTIVKSKSDTTKIHDTILKMLNARRKNAVTEHA